METPPRTAESKEKEGTGVLSALKLRVESFVTQLQKTVESGGKPLSNETRERIQKKTGNISRILGIAAAASAIAGAYEVTRISNEHKGTRYEITSELRPDGTIDYQHEDPETNRIMDYLTGTGELSAEDRAIFLRQLIHDSHVQDSLVYKSESILPLPTNLDSMSEPELREHYVAMHQRIEDTLGEWGGVSARERAESLMELQFDNNWVDPDPVNLEQVLWELQKRSGAPRIRWSEATEVSDGGGNAREQSVRGRAHFSTEDNTVYLTPGDAYSSLLAEDAHAIQDNTQPHISRAWFAIDTTITRVRAALRGERYVNAQYDQYENTRTLEYNAHSVIEPRLHEEVNRSLVQDESEPIG